MAAVAIVFVKAYKLLMSPFLPFNHCRYYPTCSEYAIAALEKYGFLKGGWLAARRIARCHPYSKRDAYDPIP